MNLWRFRKKLVSEKDYLKTIYDARAKDTVKDIIHKSTKRRLRILLIILHLAINGHIEIIPRLEKKLKKTKFINQLNSIYSTENVTKFQLQPKCVIVDFLLTVKSILPRILNPLFNKSVA